MSHSRFHHTNQIFMVGFSRHPGWQHRPSAHGRRQAKIVRATAHEVPGSDELSERASGLRLLSDAEVRGEIAQITSNPDVWAPDDVEPYFSLGGFQSKGAWHRTEDRWARPFGNTPTTHILKPRAEAAATVAIGEHLCLEAARRLGIHAAEAVETPEAVDLAKQASGSLRQSGVPGRGPRAGPLSEVAVA